MFTSRTALGVKAQKADPQYGEAPASYKAPVVVEKKDMPAATSAIKPRKMYPKDAPPKSLNLPYFHVSDEVADQRYRYVETDSFTRGNILRMIRQRKGDSVTPGWLIELGDPRLNAIMDIEQALKTIADPQNLIETLHTVINEKLLLVVSKNEICDVLNKIADTKQGLTFGRFMFTMGNPVFAKKSGILKPASKNMDCSQLTNDGRVPCQPDKDEGGDTMNDTDSSKNEIKGKPRCKEGAGAAKDPNDETGYSMREQVFYSGLLVLEMFDTLNNVERLYFQNWIPEPDNKVARHQAKRGFGIESLGMRKKGWAEWDRPLPPLPKVSPYLSSVPFVATRWKVVKPNKDERGRRRTLNQLYPMHLIIQPPEATHYGIAFRDPIRITENRQRIKQTLEYLASKGDCVALLPNIIFIIHLSDTFVDKLEEKSMKPAKSSVSDNRIYVGNEILCIARDSRTLYRPHGISPQVAQLANLICFNDAMNLRKITNHIRGQHWKYINTLKLQFRQRCWDRMHIDRLPAGMLKQSFLQSFVTYLPYDSHLPVYYTENGNPL